MPIYEFYCPDNNKLYSFLARTLAYRDKLPVCPDGEGLRMEKRVSAFAVIGKAKEESGDDPFAGVDDAKMESFMADMEREMGSMNEENPDPRQLGHFMRKMTDMMGDRTPDALKEVVRRLESGEDPEKLEEQFGSFDTNAEPGARPANGAGTFRVSSARRDLPQLITGKFRSGPGHRDEVVDRHELIDAQTLSHGCQIDDPAPIEKLNPRAAGDACKAERGASNGSSGCVPGR